MADGYVISIHGDTEVRAKIMALGKKAPNVIALGTMAGALIIQNAAKVKAPVLTGNLERSIHAEKVNQYAVQVGTDVVYAAAQEFDYNHAYLRPAADENIGQVQAVIQATIYKLLTP